MTIANEHDAIRLRQPVEAHVIGERRRVVMPEGSEGAVVAVYGPPTKPEAYEVEFVLQPLKSYALGTVGADLVTVIWRARKPSA